MTLQAKLESNKLGEDGKPLCRWCEQPVPKGRRTFCKKECVHEWRLRSDPHYVRIQLRMRDKGICKECGLDAWTLQRWFRDLPVETNHAIKAELGVHRSRKTFWDADHRVEVVEGGGECGLDNYETLCLWCHKRKTIQFNRNRSQKKEPSHERDVAQVDPGDCGRSHPE